MKRWGKSPPATAATRRLAKPRPVQGEQGPPRGCPPRARVAAKRDGHPRQNPAYRPATGKALETGLFLWTRFAGDSSGSPRGGLTAVSVEPLGAVARRGLEAVPATSRSATRRYQGCRAGTASSCRVRTTRTTSTRRTPLARVLPSCRSPSATPSNVGTTGELGFGQALHPSRPVATPALQTHRWSLVRVDQFQRVVRVFRPVNRSELPHLGQARLVPRARQCLGARNVTSPVRVRDRQRKPAPSAPGPPERRERRRARDGARDHARAHDHTHDHDLPDELESAAREHEQRRAEGVRDRRGGAEQCSRPAEELLPAVCVADRFRRWRNGQQRRSQDVRRRDRELERNVR